MDKKRILIIDDEKSFTRVVKLYLEETGAYEVREENNGLRGLNTAKEFNPDLILLDINMPHISGGEVGAQIKDDPDLKDIPILFLTALIRKSEERIVRGRLFIAKPIQMKSLITRIEAGLRQTTRKNDREITPWRYSPVEVSEIRMR